MQEHELSSVLEQYDIAVNGTRKTRGAILCDTDRGLLILKEIAVPQSRVPALCELYEYLRIQPHMQVDDPIPNREGEYVCVGADGSRFMLRRWNSGKECDIHKTAELIKAAGNLAKLHLLMQKKLENPPAIGMDQQDEYIRHNRELKKVRKFIRTLSPKGDFEHAFLQHFDQMYMWAETAAVLLRESEYDRLYQESVEHSYMAHGEYNYHNILLEQEREKGQALFITINFDRFKKDVQVGDLYYFLRKVMEKHGWKERLGDHMLNAYSAIRPLTSAETQYLRNRLVYPEKFWKIANSYYRSNKAWVPVKNIEKLHLSICQTKEKQRFLENIFAFHL